jgi:hypothetical protein
MYFILKIDSLSLCRSAVPALKPLSQFVTPSNFAANISTVPKSVSLVCFQPYTDGSCTTLAGPKQCSPQGRCTHTDTSPGYDESTLQFCSADEVSIQLFENSSSCRTGTGMAPFIIPNGQCTSMGGNFGRLSCGK